MDEQRKTQTLFLARFENELIIMPQDDKPQNVAMTGHMLVAGEVTENGELIIEEIRRVSWVTTPVEQLAGQVTLSGPVYGKEIEPGIQGAYSLEMHLYYGLLRDLPPSCTESDATFALLERIRGRVFWDVAEPNPELPQVRLKFELDEIIEPKIGAISAVILEEAVWQFEQLQGPIYSEKVANSLVSCTSSGPTPPVLGTNFDYRRLALRFVLLSKVTTASAIEGDVQAVINAACEVWWGKGGIRLDPDPNIFTATLPPSGSGYDDTDLITGASIFSVSLPKELDLPGEILAPSPITNQYVEVYLVDKLADSRGGGIAHRCASSDAYVILEISQLVHNHFLLAHELGHVFGLRHPEQTVGGGPCNDSSLPYGSTCAVMVPDRPNSPRLTTNDLAGIDAYNPDLGNAYDLLGFAGQRDTNAGANFFQIVRDFPYDDGSSPSQLRPPFSNWTSRSDIWNAAIRPYQGDVHHFYGLSNSNLFQKGDPFFAPGHFPYHHQPTYSGPNYMYVRIHTCQPLATVGANVQAHIFLAYPGVSLDSLIKLVPDGTSNPLPFVDTPQNDYQPRMGGPTVRFTKWIVPDTVPVHCCAFAVVTSINDPADTTAPPSGGLQDVINHPENHNFYSLWDRLKTDNDVAQRNYNVQGVPPGDASGALPPMPFANIFEDEATADLEIDATGADLENITLTVDGQEVAQIKGGQKERFRLHDALPPRQQLQLTMQANWQQGQPIGAAFPIGLGFYLGDKLVYDYEHLIQVVSSKEASLQAMDMMVGALRDVAAAWKLLEARKLVADVRQIVWRERGVPAGCLPLLIGWLNPPPKPWDEAFRQLGGRFRNLSQQLKEVDDTSAELVTVQQRMDTLIGLFEVTGMEMDTLMTGVREQAIFIQAIASQAARQAKMQSELQG